MTGTNTDVFQLAMSDSYDALRKLGDLNIRALTRLAGLQFELVSLGIESSVSRAKWITQPGKIEQVYANESRLASLYGHKMAQISRETTDLLLKSGNEFNSIVDEVFVTAKGSLKQKSVTTPVKQVTKPVVATPVVKTQAKKTVKRKVIKKAK